MARARELGSTFGVRLTWGRTAKTAMVNIEFGSAATAEEINRKEADYCPDFSMFICEAITLDL
jgi:hypothetical protein